MRALKIVGLVWVWCIVMVACWVMFLTCASIAEPFELFTEAKNFQYLLMGILGYIWSPARGGIAYIGVI